MGPLHTAPLRCRPPTASRCHGPRLGPGLETHPWRRRCAAGAGLRLAALPPPRRRGPSCPLLLLFLLLLLLRRYRRRGAPLPCRLSNALCADPAEGPRLFHTAPTRAGGRTRLTARLRAPGAASSVPRRRLARPLARPLPASPDAQRRRLPARPLGSARDFAGHSLPLPTSLPSPPPLAARGSAAISSPPAPSSPRPVSEKKGPLGGHFGTGHAPERQSRIGGPRDLPATKMGGGFDGSGGTATAPLLFVERRHPKRGLRIPPGAEERRAEERYPELLLGHVRLPAAPSRGVLPTPAEERAGSGLSPPRNKARSPVHGSQLAALPPPSPRTGGHGRFPAREEGRVASQRPRCTSDRGSWSPPRVPLSRCKKGDFCEASVSSGRRN